MKYSGRIRTLEKRIPKPMRSCTILVESAYTPDAFATAYREALALGTVIIDDVPAGTPLQGVGLRAQAFTAQGKDTSRKSGVE